MSKYNYNLTNNFNYDLKLCL